MATEAKYPDAIAASTNLTGLVTAIDEDPDSPDANWLTATSATAATDVRVTFPTPTGTPLGTQNFRCQLRKTTGAPGPTVDIQLYQNGAARLTLVNDQSITSTSGEVVQADWNSSDLSGTLTGSDVECRIVSTPGTEGGVGALPAYASAGTLFDSATMPQTNLLVNMPTHAVGDLLICLVLCRNTNNNGLLSSVNGTGGSGGWTLDNNSGSMYGGAQNARIGFGWKVAASTSEAISITTSGGTTTDRIHARVYRFTAADGFSSPAIASVGSATTGTLSASQDMSMPTVASGGTNELGLCIYGISVTSTVTPTATVVDAASPGQTDVANAIAAVAPGGIVNIPAGSATWSSAVTITKSLTLSGAGGTSTHITGNFDPAIIEISLTEDVPIRITGIYFDKVTSVNGTRPAILVWGTDYDGGGIAVTKLRIDHNRFNFGDRAVYTNGDVRGVIDHNYFNNCCVSISPTGDGANSWTRPITAGTADALFIEDNTFYQDNNALYSQETIYHFGAPRTVIRYNTFDGQNLTNFAYLPLEAHANQSYWNPADANSRLMRGAPIIEVYNNNFHTNNTYRMVYFRGGSQLIHDNTFINDSGDVAWIMFNEEESWQTSFFSPLRTEWPAQDQINNTFIWNNTGNGSAITSVSLGDALDAPFIQENRDYFMHAPQASGGSESYTGTRQGGSTAPPTQTDTGSMTFTASGANKYYPYTAYTYPHPFVTDGGGGAGGGINWTEPVAEDSGTNACTGILVADLSDGSGMTGGSAATSATTGVWAALGMRLVPASSAVNVNTVEIGAIEWNVTYALALTCSASADLVVLASPAPIAASADSAIQALISASPGADVAAQVSPSPIMASADGVAGTSLLASVELETAVRLGRTAAGTADGVAQFSRVVGSSSDTAVLQNISVGTLADVFAFGETAVICEADTNVSISRSVTADDDCVISSAVERSTSADIAVEGTISATSSLDVFSAIEFLASISVDLDAAAYRFNPNLPPPTIKYEATVAAQSHNATIVPKAAQSHNATIVPKIPAG